MIIGVYAIDSFIHSCPVSTEGELEYRVPFKNDSVKCLTTQEEINGNHLAS